MNRSRKELVEFSAEVRRDIVRMVGKAGSGHPGGALSIVDILTVLFTDVMNLESGANGTGERDHFILSKGHAAPALYSVLARTGFFDVKLLDSFRTFGSPLQGHPDCRKLNGVDISTGALGQGLSVAGGMGLGFRTRAMASRIYVLMGDGEIEEGQVWEAAMAIAHFRLNNVVAIVDSNGLQLDGTVEEIMNVHPVDAKFMAFGWDAVTIDGHDFSQIEEALRGAGNSGKPTVVIARTVKGKGVSYMENRVEFHHAKNLSPERVAEAMASIDESAKEALCE